MVNTGLHELKLIVSSHTRCGQNPRQPGSAFVVTQLLDAFVYPRCL